MPLTIRGDLHGDGLRVTVLVARWNAPVTDRLLAGALEVLAAAGVADDDVTVMEVPGAFELPQAAGFVAASGRADAIVALGCLVQGETHHDRVIADACARGLTDVALATAVPVTFGVITALTQAQADARSNPAAPPGKGGHKGREAAEAAIRLADALRQGGLTAGSHRHPHGKAPAPARKTTRASKTSRAVESRRAKSPSEGRRGASS